MRRLSPTFFLLCGDVYKRQLQSEMGVPCCTIEKEYALGSVGQLRTRFQAFVESLEIKKINA